MENKPDQDRPVDKDNSLSRREFLKAAGLGALSLGATAAKLPKTPFPPPESYKYQETRVKLNQENRRFATVDVIVDRLLENHQELAPNRQELLNNFNIIIYSYPYNFDNPEITIQETDRKSQNLRLDEIKIKDKYILEQNGKVFIKVSSNYNMTLSDFNNLLNETSFPLQSPNPENRWWPNKKQVKTAAGLTALALALKALFTTKRFGKTVKQDMSYKPEDLEKANQEYKERLIDNVAQLADEGKIQPGTGIRAVNQYNKER